MVVKKETKNVKTTKKVVTKKAPVKKPVAAKKPACKKCKCVETMKVSINTTKKPVKKSFWTKVKEFFGC